MRPKAKAKTWARARTSRPEPQDDHQPPQLRARRVRVRAQARMVHVEPRRCDRPPREGAHRPRHPLPRPRRARGAAARAARSRRPPRRARIEPDVRGHTDHALYLTAAMTGIREGELSRPALARRGLVRRRSSASVATTPAARWGRRSQSAPRAPCRWPTGSAASSTATSSGPDYQGDDDLVFCHPHTGEPYDASQLRKRFYDAMKAAGLGHRCGRQGGITFHSLRHTFGTRMAAPACRCARCRSGWAIATWRRPKSMPTMRPIRLTAPRSPKRRSRRKPEEEERRGRAAARRDGQRERRSGRTGMSLTVEYPAVAGVLGGTISPVASRPGARPGFGRASTFNRTPRPGPVNLATVITKHIGELAP